jgi:lipoprotein-releasing system ATP-binding protein
MVSVTHIARTFADTDTRLEILRDVTFTLAEAEMVGLLGVSGSGKTTLLQIMGGLDAATAGSVTVRGKEVGRMSPVELAAYRSTLVGFVFQFHHLLPDFTALENTFIPGLIAGKTRRQCSDRGRELLDAVGLGERVSHYPSELSGGERQRVALARALFNEPALVLADEPTGNLDPQNGKHLLELIHRLNQRFRQTFLVATHNDQLAGGMHRSIRLENGVIAA